MNHRTSLAPVSLAVLGALAASLAGCGGGGGGSSATLAPISTTPTTPTPTPVTPAPTAPAPAPVLSVSAPALSHFTVSLEQNTDTISAGGTVSYTLRLKNTSPSSAAIVADIVSSQFVPKATLRITSAQGVIVYPVQQPAAHDALAPPAPPSVNASTATLAPGNSLTPLSRTIRAFAVPGVYRAQAVFTVAAAPADTPQTVSLSPLLVTVK